MALVLVVGLTIVGTLAWLSTKSNPVTNVFTASNNIYVNLIEPDYDPDKATSYKPDGQIDKSPQLVNTTGDDSSEWVMLRVDYLQKNDTTNEWENKSYESDFKNKLFTLTGLTGENWEEVTIPAGTTVKETSGEKTSGYLCKFYVYKKALVANSNVGATYRTQTALESAINKNDGDDGKLTLTGNVSTTPLFTKVTIQSEATLKANGYWDNTKNELNLPAFNIVIQGAAVKNEGDDAGLGKTGDNYNDLDNGQTSTNIKNKLLELLADKAPSKTSGQAS